MDTKEKQVLALLDTLEDLTYKQKKAIAAKCNVVLDPPKVKEQVADGYLKLNHVPRKAEEGTVGKDYAVIPSLHLGTEDPTRPLWVRLEAARDVGERLIALADEAEKQ